MSKQYEGLARPPFDKSKCTSNGRKVTFLSSLQKHKCIYCGIKTQAAKGTVQADNTATFDHHYGRWDIRRALSQRGVMACMKCNSMRGISDMRALYYDFSEVFDIRDLIINQTNKTQMDFKLTIGCTPELQRVLEALVQAFAGKAAPAEVVASTETVEKTAEPAPDKPVRQIKKAAPKVEETAKSVEELVVSGEIQEMPNGNATTTIIPAGEGTANTTSISLEDLRAFANTKVVAGKKVELKALLDKYEAKSVALLDPSQFDAFHNDLKKIA